MISVIARPGGGRAWTQSTSLSDPRSLDPEVYVFYWLLIIILPKWISGHISKWLLSWDTVQAKIKWPHPSKSLHYSYRSSDIEAVIQVYREAEKMTSSPCFFVTCKDFWWLVAITMIVEKNTDHIPYSVKSISHNKGIFLSMPITKFSKPCHVA